MLFPLLLQGIEDPVQGDLLPHNHKQGADWHGSGPSNRLVLFVIALVLCHIGAVVGILEISKYVDCIVWVLEAYNVLVQYFLI